MLQKNLPIEVIVEDQGGSKCTQSAPAVCGKHAVVMWTAEHWEGTLREELSVVTVFLFSVHSSIFDPVWCFLHS